MSGISVATIKSPEFINITSVSPLISKCEIKVLYTGENRNRSYISKEVAQEMAQTLPGTPIVGYYSEKEEDFRDHGDQIIVDGDGIQFNCLTKPYGFVPLETKVWFQEFEDTDEFGNKVNREYLMCEGYLWTEAYQEAQKVINESRPQSMELDEKTLKGHWSTDVNRGIEFFIINDAIFTKLCILGEDVEPCFEGAQVASPDINKTFTKDNNEFVHTLYSMMQELKEYTYSLKQEGGTSMSDIETKVEVQSSEEPVVDAAGAAEVSEEFTQEENSEKFLNSEDNSVSEVIAENQNITEEFKKNEEEDKNEGGNESESTSSDDETDEKEDEDKKKPTKSSLEEEKSIEEKYSLLETEFNELQQKYASLEEQNKELVAFKAEVENKEKDALIESFYMLSDEDKKNVIENKAKFTLDEIEKELSVICVRKKVNFNLEEENNTESAPTTFNLSSEEDNLPAWIKAVEAHKNAE